MSVLVLSSPLVFKPVHVRYAWARSPIGNLQAAAHSDIPFAIQRSDDWTLEDLYQAYTGKTCKSPGKLDRGESEQLHQAMRAADLGRRMAEAETLLRANGEKTP